MSSKLIKQPGSLIEFPNDHVIIDLKVYQSGKVQLQAPNVQPADVCKFLNNISIDVTYAALKSDKSPTIDTSQMQGDQNVGQA